MTDETFILKQPRCIICGSNEDYICEEHYSILQSYSTQTCKLSIAVIGDTTPREADRDPDMFPVISCHARVCNYINFMYEELDTEDYRNFKILIVFTEEGVKLMKDDDFEHMLYLSVEMTTAALVFESETCYNMYMEKYLQWQPAEGYDLPLAVKTKDWLCIFSYLRDIEDDRSSILYHKVMTTE